MPRNTRARQLAEQQASAAMSEALDLSQMGIGEFFFGAGRGQQLERSIADQKALDAALFDQDLQQQELQRVADAPGLLAEAQAAGLQTRQIPGLMGALEQGGRGVLESVLANPSAPLQPGAAGQRAMRQEAAQLSLQTQRQNLAAAEANAKAGALKLEAISNGQLPPNERLGVVNTWSDDWINASENGREVLVSRKQALNALQQDDALGSYAAIVKLAKILDPGSVVRSEEGRAVAEGQGIARQIADSYNKMVGDNFTAESKANFIATINSVSLPSAEELASMAGGYTALASRWNINPEDIFRGTLMQQDLFDALGVSMQGAQ